MKIIKRYEYFGPRGVRWTDWIDLTEVETQEQVNDYIREQRALNNNRNEEYKVIP